MVYGYARVSTKGQEDNNSLLQQENELRAAGATEVIREAFTGTKSHRPQLDSLLSRLQPGDTIIVTKMDRIARSAKGGLELIDSIIDKGASIRIMNMGTFDDSPTGKLIRTVMLGFAEFERDMIVQRTQEGKAIAKQREDFREGRPRKYKPEQISHAMSLLDSGNSFSKVSLMTGISVSTLKRAKRSWRDL